MAIASSQSAQSLRLWENPEWIEILKEQPWPFEKLSILWKKCF